MLSIIPPRGSSLALGVMSSKQFFQLIELSYQPARLIVRVAELVEGEPDGYIGTPLVVSATSKMHSILFEKVADFRSRAEPCFSFDGEHRDITGFAFECLDSSYIKESCPFGIGATRNVRHFGIFTESVVIEVLSSSHPRIEVIAENAQQSVQPDRREDAAPG
jgi:hypothetical protein